MLAEQVVDADHGRDRAVLTDATDADRRLGIAAECDLKFQFLGDAHAVAERRINGHAAIERALGAVGALPELADKAQFGDPDFGIAIALGRHRNGQGGHDGEHDGVGGIDGKQGAHFRSVVQRTDAAILRAVEQHDRF